jgi:hypothetical protein
MALGTLKDVLPAPSNPKDNSGDWSAIEATLGASLPNDYKEFIEIYGTIHICNFLQILSPFSKNQHINLVRKQELCREVYQVLKNGGENIPYEFFPKRNGLIIVGLTDNGDSIFWKTGSEKWTIVVNEARGTDWFCFDGSIAEFIEGLLLGDVDCCVFPNDAFKK